MAHTLLFQLRVGRKRDVITARQRARQLAVLLGYTGADVTRLASAVFELARQTYEQVGHAILHVELSDGALHVVPHPNVAECAEMQAPLLRLELPLPAGASLAVDDAAWMAQQLLQLTPVNTFEEIGRLNQELLHALLELRACQERLAEATAPHYQPSAA